jgi:hypothetical protein
MSNLYLQIENDVPINHPASEENLIKAFGCIPADWEKFNRIDFPETETFQVLEFPSPPYKKINGTWTDAWYLREMTTEEKAAKQLIIDEQMEMLKTKFLPPVAVTVL